MANGNQLATYFAARHLHIDRTTDTISGTEVRADLAANWDCLSTSTRAGLVCRVVMLGAESTGTTTITEAVAAHYRQNGSPWDRTQTVGEYGREHTQEIWDVQRTRARSSGRPDPTVNDIVWQLNDFDAFATAIWERRYLGSAARSVPSWAQPPALPAHHLYLLTSHRGVPWLDDGIREGDLTVRAAMTDWFADALTKAGHPWVMLEGTLSQRLALALRAIDPVLRRRLTIADPLSGPGFPSSDPLGTRQG